MGNAAFGVGWRLHNFLIQERFVKDPQTNNEQMNTHLSTYTLDNCNRSNQ